MFEKVGIGVLGCGKIAPAYLRNLSSGLGKTVKLIACADLDRELAQCQADEFGIPKVLDTDALLDDPEVEIVINLTPAPLHHGISMQILEAKKHLFTEKPLSLSLEHGREILDKANASNLMVAGAADTFMGSSLQAARKLIDEGKVGDPIAAIALVSIGLFDSERYHKVFRGALLDLGPYYLTALIHLFGPIAMASGAAETRFIQRKDRDTGKEFELDQPSTAAGMLQFRDGPVATILASQDVHGYFPRVEILGTKGKLTLSDANYYGGAMTFETKGASEVIEPAGREGFAAEGRGLGVAEMALALREGREPRAGGKLLYHVLEAMLGIYESAGNGTRYSLHSNAERPSLLTEGELGDLIEKEAIG